MKISTVISGLCFTLVSCCVCNFVCADLSIGFSNDVGASFLDEFEVTAGDSLTIGIYLRQTDTETVLTSEGIISFGLELTRSPSGLGTIESPTASPSFDTANHNVVTTTGFEWEYGESAGLGVTGDNVFLGSFQFEAASIGETTFTLGDRLVGSGVGNASWFTSSFAEIDEQIFGANAANTFQFTVNSTAAVPEPGCLAVLGICLGGWVLRRRRNSGRPF